MSKLDLARRVVRASCAATGEPYEEKAAEKLAARETMEALGRLVEDAERGAALPAPAGNPLADAARNPEGLELASEADRWPEATPVRVKRDRREGATWGEVFLTGQPARLRVLVRFPKQGDDAAYEQHHDLDALERLLVEAPDPRDPWAAKPWLRPGVRVILPELRPGESDEAPDGMPAERGVVGQILGDAGTCVVTVDPEYRDGAEDDGERTVSIDDVEPAPDQTLAGAHAAETLTKHAIEVRRLEKKVELARGRARRATEEVARLEKRLAVLKAARR